MPTPRRWPKGTWMKLISADTLRALMQQNAMGYSRLARYAGCHRSFISHLASGRRTTCTPKLAARLAEALNVPLEVLFVPSVSSDSGTTVTERVA